MNSGNPVLTQATQNPVPGAATAPNIYWPSLINTATVGLSNPLDNYYMYLTTDHSVGGIYLFTAPTPIGPWTGRGKVYDDPVGPTGNGSAETFTAFADPSGTTKLMGLYQIAQATGAVGTQSTIWASSNDGINWTRGALPLILPRPLREMATPGTRRLQSSEPLSTCIRFGAAGTFQTSAFGFPTTADERSRRSRCWDSVAM